MEGSLGFFAGSLIFKATGALILPIPFLYILIGSAVGALVELFSEAIDDKFTVSIVRGVYWPLSAISFRSDTA